MKKRRCFVILSILLSVSATTQGQEWNRYISAKKGERNKIESKAQMIGSGRGQNTNGGVVVKATWVTALVAQAKVSQIIDEERISNDVAEERFASFRSTNEYRFYILLYCNIHPDPVNRNGVFLQRAEDHKFYSRGLVKGGSYIGSDGFWNTYVYEVSVPKRTEAGEVIIRDLNDQVELSLSTPGSTATVKFKIKDIVARLEDL